MNLFLYTDLCNNIGPLNRSNLLVDLNKHLPRCYVRVTIEIRLVFDSNVYFQLITQRNCNAYKWLIKGFNCLAN